MYVSGTEVQLESQLACIALFTFQPFFITFVYYLNVVGEIR